VPAAAVQLVADLHGAESYRRWRRRQLDRIPGAFVPDLDLHDGYAVVTWAVRPGALVDFLRRGRTKALLRPPTVGKFQADTEHGLAVAAAVADWIEESETPTALAPPLVRADGRARVVTLDREWPLPRTELVR
jgi:hypothetical protein